MLAFLRELGYVFCTVVLNSDGELVRVRARGREREMEGEREREGEREGGEEGSGGGRGGGRERERGDGRPRCCVAESLRGGQGRLAVRATSVPRARRPS